MTHDFKPGDVAMADGPGYKGIIFRHADLSSRDDEWMTAKEGGYYGTAARRLVVIDAEDREQVERLRKVLIDSGAFVGLTRGNVSKLQAALREFANPQEPKPAWTDGDVVASDCRAYYRHQGEWYGTRATSGPFSDADIDETVERGSTILRRQSDEATP